MSRGFARFLQSFSIRFTYRFSWIFLLSFKLSFSIIKKISFFGIKVFYKRQENTWYEYLTSYIFSCMPTWFFSPDSLTPSAVAAVWFHFQRFLIAGLPPHAAIATNKISSPFGTALATYRFAKAKLINLKLAAPAVVSAICGSFIGAQISLRVPEHILSYVLMVILPVSAFLVLNKKLFNDEGSEEITLNRRTYLTATIAAFIVGCYDGFYGPGTGTFLIIAFTVFAHLNIQTANAQAKVINLTTNLTALAIFLYNGQGVLSLGSCICSLQYAWRIHRCRTCDEKRF